jgi:hypothetical protein
VRIYVSAILACTLLAGMMPGTAPAATTQTLQQQIRALQAQLNALQHQVERLQAKRVPRRRAKQRAAVLGAWRPGTPATTPIAQTAVLYATPGPAAAMAMTTTSAAASAPSSLGTPGPQQASVKNTYQQENALFQKGLTVTPSFTYSYGDNRFFTLNGFMALGAIFLGNIDVARQQNTVFSPSVNLTYGANKRLQYDLTVPFSVRTATYVSAGTQNSSNQQSDKSVSGAGLGDVNAGLYYALPQKRIGGPSVILNAHFTAPTGRAPYGVKIVQDRNGNDSLSYATSLPTGGGVWGLSAGATVIQQTDPAILFAGLNYYYNFPSGFKDISPQDGTTQPGWVQPGDALSVTLGTAFALNDKMSTSFSVQDTLVRSTRVRPVGGAWTTIAGSSLNAALFNIGATFAVNQHTSYQTMLGIGITHDAPNFQFTVRVPHS